LADVIVLHVSLTRFDAMLLPLKLRPWRYINSIVVVVVVVVVVVLTDDNASEVITVTPAFTYSAYWCW